MKVVAIIQARMGSTRLPGKVLRDIDGRPMLWRVVRRAETAESLDEVVVATTVEPADDAIVDFCRNNEIDFFRGSEEDVLDRYYQTALQHGAEAIVRITSDCPLIDPEVVDKTVRAFLAEQPDYASNTLTRTYPRGLDTEVMTFKALERAWREAEQSYQRAHVTPYLYENAGHFRTLSVHGKEDHGDCRWTVDTPEDLEFVQAVYSRLQGQQFRWTDVISLLERQPDLAEINRSIAQKALHEG